MGNVNKQIQLGAGVCLFKHPITFTLWREQAYLNCLYYSFKKQKQNGK